MEKNMKFTLLFYTDGWETGPTIELSHMPAPGSVVWTEGRHGDEEESMYYVDNVMYPERGMEREESVYLYVRPYEGYTRYAPLTENDRLAERLGDLRTELAEIGRRLDGLLTEVAELRKTTEGLRQGAEALGGAAVRDLEGMLRIGEQALQSVDVLEDGQEAHIGKLDDIALALEQIKEQM